MDKIMFTISQAQDYIVYTDKCKIITRNILKKMATKCFGDVKIYFYLIYHMMYHITCVFMLIIVLG